MTDRAMHQPSPRAWERLSAAVEDDFDDADDLMGDTDCPDHCNVEPDGHCPHGFESAALTGGII
jgi:hypothetical protein